MSKEAEACLRWVSLRKSKTSNEEQQGSSTARSRASHSNVEQVLVVLDDAFERERATKGPNLAIGNQV